MPRDPIQYFDRYDGKTKIEKIFGESYLRFAYENPVGRFAVWLLFRRAFFSWPLWAENEQARERDPDHQVHRGL